VKVRVAKVKLIRHSRVKASVVLRVSGPKGKVPVRIRFQAKTKVAKGKKVMSAARMVTTNELVRINGLRTPNARRLVVRVSLIS
jgi:hypothetical protein